VYHPLFKNTLLVYFQSFAGVTGQKLSFDSGKRVEVEQEGYLCRFHPSGCFMFNTECHESCVQSDDFDDSKLGREIVFLDLSEETSNNLLSLNLNSTSFPLIMYSGLYYTVHKHDVDGAAPVWYLDKMLSTRHFDGKVLNYQDEYYNNDRQVQFNAIFRCVFLLSHNK